MCQINKLTSGACLANAAGIKGIGYMAPAQEFAAWPAFQTASTPGDGKTVQLTGNFSFTGAGTGKGYFRSFPMLMEKGGVTYKAVGGVGSKSLEVLFNFYVVGVDAVQLEWLKDVKNIPGVFLCPDKNGTLHVLGSKDDPAYMQEADGGTGVAATDDRGVLYTIRWLTNIPTLYTGTINETPIV